MKYLILLLFPVVSFASGYNGQNSTNNSTYNSTYKGSDASMALSAAQLNFDWSTQALQLSGGVGAHNGSQAFSIGLGKRVGRVLLNGSMTSGGGFAAGFTLRYK